jgi:outer membrane protein assembly factor BamB
MKKIYAFVFLLLFFFQGNGQTTPMFRGNLSHTGVFDSTSIVHPVLKWKYRTSGQIYSSPVVWKDLLFIGSNDGCLYAIDKQEGQLKWKFKTGRRIKSTPAVHNGVVYFGSFDSTFYAVDGLSGVEKWRFKTNGETVFGAKNIYGIKSGNLKCPDPWDFYASSPAYYDHAIYFGSGDSSVYCLNADDGKKIWSYKTQGIVHSSPAIFDNKVYVGSWDSKIFALDAKTGALVWDFQTGTDSINNCFVGIQASPVLSDGILYCGSRDAFMYALDAKTGRVKWQVKDPYLSWLPSSVAVKDGFLYLGSSDALRFYVLDQANGKMVSEYKTGIYTFSSPAIFGQMSFVGAMNGRLYAFDLPTGLPKWVFSTDAALNSLYFNKDGDYNLENSKDVFDSGMCWELTKNMEQIVSGSGSILSSPFVEKGVLYFAATDGYVYALEDGNIHSGNIEYFDFTHCFSEVKSVNELNYKVDKPTKISIHILNDQGVQVKTLLKGEVLPGSYSLNWDGTDKETKRVPAGNYTARISLGRSVKYHALKLE